MVGLGARRLRSWPEFEEYDLERCWRDWDEVALPPTSTNVAADKRLKNCECCACALTCFACS